MATDVAGAIASDEQSMLRFRGTQPAASNGSTAARLSRDDPAVVARVEAIAERVARDVVAEVSRPRA